MLALLPLLLLPAYNLKVMAGASEAVLEYKVTLRMEPYAIERAKPGSFLSLWSKHTRLKVPTSGHLLCEKKKKKDFHIVEPLLFGDQTDLTGNRRKLHRALRR